MKINSLTSVGSDYTSKAGDPKKAQGKNDQLFSANSEDTHVALKEEGNKYELEVELGKNQEIVSQKKKGKNYITEVRDDSLGATLIYEHDKKTGELKKTTTQYDGSDAKRIDEVGKNPIVTMTIKDADGKDVQRKYVASDNDRQAYYTVYDEKTTLWFIKSDAFVGQEPDVSKLPDDVKKLFRPDLAQ